MYISILEDVVQYDGVVENVVSTCQDYGIVNLLQITLVIMDILQIVVPIVAIVAIIKILTQLVMNPEDKKLRTGIRNWLLALFTFFFLPIIFNATMQLLDPSFTIAACWKEAIKKSTVGFNSIYQETDDQKNKVHIVNKTN